MRRVMTIVAASVLVLGEPAARADAPVPINIGWITVPISLAPIFEAKKDVTKHYGKTYALNGGPFRRYDAADKALATGDSILLNSAFPR